VKDSLIGLVIYFGVITLVLVIPDVWARWRRTRADAAYRRGYDVGARRARDEGVAAGWAAGYEIGHALGLEAGEARLRREWALARLAVEAKHAPLTTSEDDAENGDWLDDPMRDAADQWRRRMGRDAA
jgi:hypothetical protein